MNDLVTVFTATYASELAVIQSMLEAEGIDTFLKDELSVQSNPLYSNAIGGVKLQVRGEDVPRAAGILSAAGLLKDEKPSALRERLDRFTAKLPLVNRVMPELRLLILGAVLTLAVIGVYYLTTLSSVHQSLTERKWCVDYIVYKQQEYTPNSWGLQLEIPGMKFCKANLELHPDGKIIFPGFNTGPVYGTWSFENDKVIVAHTDTFRQVYQGEYEVSISFDKMVLSSPVTAIHCYELFN